MKLVLAVPADTCNRIRDYLFLHFTILIVKDVGKGFSYSLTIIFLSGLSAEDLANLSEVDRTRMLTIYTESLNATHSATRGVKISIAGKQGVEQSSLGVLEYAYQGKERRGTVIFIPIIYQS